MSGSAQRTLIAPRCRAIAAATLVSLAWATSAPAQSGLLTDGVLTDGAQATKQQTFIEPFEDWQVICDEAPDSKSSCSMAISGKTTDADGRLVGIRLSQLPVKTRSDALFAIETPLDLLLSKGIEMRVDGGPVMRLAFRSCHSDGCLAPFSMISTIARRFRKGDALDIRVFDLNARPIEVRLSLQGFSAAGRRAGI